mgnify:CR=1 FL=1|tara:strand:- start:73 stop:567 length:495 start_codon:yes stop_codon:yes gene_type:complete
MMILRGFLPALALTGVFLGAAFPARADLGAAEAGPRQELSGRKYEAWCGTEENIECTVEFSGERMIVDGGKGITVDQLKNVLTSQKFFRDKHEGVKGSQCKWLGLGPAGCHVYFEFNYVSSDGSNRWATVRFMNRKVSAGFRSDLEAWTGEPLRNIGPAVKIVE